MFGEMIVDWNGCSGCVVNVMWINEVDVDCFYVMFVECIVKLF